MTGRTIVLLLGGGILLTLAALVGGPFYTWHVAVSRGVPLVSATPRPTTPISGREAASPEFTARLNAAFPRGSDANTVAAGLSTEGFRPIGPCRDNPRNERAGFEQRGGGIAGPYPVSALAA